MPNRESCKNCGNTTEEDALYACDRCGKITCEDCDESTLPGFIYCPICDQHTSDFYGFIRKDTIFESTSDDVARQADDNDDGDSFDDASTGSSYESSASSSYGSGGDSRIGYTIFAISVGIFTGTFFAWEGSVQGFTQGWMIAVWIFGFFLGAAAPAIVLGVFVLIIGLLFYIKGP